MYNINVMRYRHYKRFPITNSLTNCVNSTNSNSNGRSRRVRVQLLSPIVLPPWSFRSPQSFTILQCIVHGASSSSSLRNLNVICSHSWRVYTHYVGRYSPVTYCRIELCVLSSLSKGVSTSGKCCFNLANVMQFGIVWRNRIYLNIERACCEL